MEKDIVKDEKRVDKIVLKCYYNICRYYNKKHDVIKEFIKIKLSKKLS